MYLEMESYQLSWEKDLRSAREINNQNKFDLIILDLGLPDGFGMNLCKELREAGASIPIIMLTAQADEESVGLGTFRRRQRLYSQTLR